MTIYSGLLIVIELVRLCVPPTSLLQINFISQKSKNQFHSTKIAVRLHVPAFPLHPFHREVMKGFPANLAATGLAQTVSSCGVGVCNLATYHTMPSRGEEGSFACKPAPANHEARAAAPPVKAVVS